MPSGGFVLRLDSGITGLGSIDSGDCPLELGLPLTITSPRKLSSFVALSFLGLKLNSSGVLSIKAIEFLIE